MLKESDARTWTFESYNKYSLDDCQEAKSKVYQENDDVENYRDLRARVVHTGKFRNNYVVVVEKH